MGATGENTPFAKQSRKKEQDHGHDRGYATSIRLGNTDVVESVFLGTV